MELLGDLERAFAASIYPNRVLIAAAGLGVLLGLALLARRRRWDLAARRRPRLALAGAVVALAVVGPLGWYLGSPLLLSSRIDEPPPAVAVNNAPSRQAPVEPSNSATAPTPTVFSRSSTPRSTTAPTAPAPTEPPSSPAPVQRLERSGTFDGADDFHFGRGTARLIETAPGAFTVRLEDFAVRNGPDLYVYLSPSADGYARTAVEVGRLKADRGNQNYRVPATYDVGRARSVVIWCKQFGVLFATARLD